ncbi:MAG: glycosyltransferase [Halanaerobiales bacterium]|nr:glycosyltransferase [Halanaerobiales bacterium]
MIKLSICILTVSSRLETYFSKLIRHLEQQIGDKDDIEIAGLFDNKKRTVGSKRNAMILLAQGEYIVFIDDDDRVADDYVSSIMDTLYAHPEADCVVFDCETKIDGGESVYSKYSIQYDYSQDGNQWRGKPAHTMVYRTEIAKNHKYADINYGEDIDWVMRASQDVVHEIRIDKTLYFYDFNNNVTETRS